MLGLLLRHVAAAHHARAMDAFVVRATDTTSASSGRPGALRVLLTGSGVTSGWGVQTHGLALLGQLQRSLQVRLGLPVDVEQVSRTGAVLADAPDVLGDRAAERWDAIVLAFGMSDAMRLTRDAEWARALGRLLAKLDADMPPGRLVPIVVVGVPPMESLGALQLLLPLRSLVGRHGDRLNAVTERVVARNRRVELVPLAGMANSLQRPAGSPEAYRAWAEAITDRLEPLVTREAPEVDAAPGPAEDLEAVGIEPPGSGAPQGDAALDDEPSAAGTGAAGRSRDPRRPGPVALVRRRTRLRTEGQRLTGTAAVRSVPTGSDVRLSGPDPLRVLVVGGEYSVGFGARTRAEALDGALARLLQVRTGRGVIVENRAQHLVRLHRLSASLGPAGAHTFDLVVWTPTFIEATTLLLRSRWVAGVELMLRRIAATSDASVVLVGVPNLLGAQPLAVIGRARAAQVNRLLRRVAARHDRVEVAEPPAIALQQVEQADGPEVYRQVAVRVLPVAMALLARVLDDRHGPDPARVARSGPGAQPVPAESPGGERRLLAASGPR